MEIMLAIAVIAAVLIFGALISAGNERQRRAIDALREQAELWAIQDLRLKRERLAREVRMDDPLGWLNRLAAKVCGRDMNLRVAQAFEEPRALLSMGERDTDRIVFSPLSPGDIRRLRRKGRNRLSNYATENPLLHLPANMTVHELSILNCGMFFDLELPLAWKALTDQRVEQMERLWMYVVE
jgi:hypothetical protein